MNTLLYLCSKTAKNKLFRWKTILNLLIYILLLSPILSMGKFDAVNLSINFYEFIYFSVLFILFLIVALTISYTGTVIFEKADYHFLFLSPIPPNRIFFYGIYKKLKPFLLMILLIIFACWGTLKNTLVFSTVQITGIYFGILLCVIDSFIIGALLNNLKNKLIGLVPIIIVAVGYIVYMIISLNKYGFNNCFNEKLNLIPIFGWINGILFNALFKSLSQWKLILLVAFLINIALISIWFTKSHWQYGRLQHYDQYKNQITKIDMNDLIVKPMGGTGATSIYYKYIREDANKRKLFWLDWGILVAIVVIVAISIGISQSTFEDKSLPNIFIMMFSCFIAAFTLDLLPSTNYHLVEMDKHFFKLLPFNWFVKGFWLSFYGFIKSLTGGWLCLIFIGIFIKAPISQIISCMILYISLHFMYKTGSLIYKKLTQFISPDSLAAPYIKILINTIFSIPFFILLIILFSQKESNYPVWGLILAINSLFTLLTLRISKAIKVVS